MNFVVEMVDIESLIPDPDNARKHDDKNLSAIRSSIKQFDVVESLVVRRKDNVVIGGNGRLTVLKELGFKKVPVKYVDFDDTKSRALSIALNRTAELAEWDDEVLSKTLDALLNEGFEVEDIGFDIDDIPGTGKEEIKEAKDTETEFLVVIECDNEIDQAQIYEELQSRNIKCKIM